MAAASTALTLAFHSQTIDCSEENERCCERIEEQQQARVALESCWEPGDASQSDTEQNDEDAEEGSLRVSRRPYWNLLE